MARTREIKKRIGAVKTIQRITRTMQMIATVKFTSALQRSRASKPFSERIQGLVGEALAAEKDFEHRLVDGPAESPNRERLLVVTSNRGFCGGYNANVLRTAMEHIRGLAGKSRALDLETAGKKAVNFFNFQRIAVGQSHIFEDQPSFDEVERLAGRYLDDFMEGKYDEVRVLSMHYISNARQVPRVVRLLPLEPAPPAEAEGPRATYEFSPSHEAILEELMPLAVKTMLYQAFLDASISEQIMRMIAMKGATENAKEVGRTLTRRYNRTRQTQITTELMEIIGGAAALE